MIHTPYRDIEADRIELAMHRQRVADAAECDDEPVHDIDQVRAEYARTAACVRRSAELWEFFREDIKNEKIDIKSNGSRPATAA